MLSTMRTATLFAPLFGGLAGAHMFLYSPTPIEGNAVKPPLNANGDNFPCHGVALPTSGGQKMAAGSQQLLAWQLDNGANTAVHGGGSCQISITYETDAVKVKDPSNWHVIYSIEGGCPSNTMLNLDAQYSGGPGHGGYTGALPCSDPSTNGVDCVNEFNFTMPMGVRSANAILSWSWFNTVGNREFYMNCVNVDLTGGDGSEMSSFPSMFVANVNVGGDGSCGTTEQTNLKFPNPGKYVTTKTASTRGSGPFASGTYKLAGPTGSGCAAGTGAPASPTAAYGGGASSSALAASSYAAPAATGGSTSVAPVVIITTAASAPSAPAATAPAPAPSGNGSTAGTVAPSSAGNCPAGQVPCSANTAFFCISSTQFGMCEPNGCAVPQSMATGTHCQNGAIVAASKRDVDSAHKRHLRKHVAGRVSF